MLIQTTTTRLTAALDAMKRQANAAMAMMPIPGNNPKSARLDLRDAQVVMRDHEPECILIHKAAQIWKKSIPDIELAELIDTGVCGLADIQNT